MEEKYLYQLAEFVLPSDALNYFTTPGSSLLLIFLDEKIEEGHSDDIHFESRDFMDPVEMTDFFIRDPKVIWALYRRRWMDIRIGKSFFLPLILTSHPLALVIPKSSELS